MFGSSPKKPQAQQQTVYTGVQIQTSSYGVTLPLLYGTMLVAPNLIWYGDFASHKNKDASGSPSGGKGGKPKSESSYTISYTASLAYGLCEGPIVGMLRAIYNQYVYSSYTQFLNYLTTGTLNQLPWSYLSSGHPGDAFPYSGIAYAGTINEGLGTSASLASHSFEVMGIFADSVPGSLDADASMVVADFVSSPNHGAGFPAALVGDLSQYQNYTRSVGLNVTLYLDTQQTASQTLDDLFTATNSAPVWSEGKLTVVPYGDTAVTANGFTYTPPATPLFDLTDDDFVKSDSGGPVKLDRKRPSDAYNQVTVEYLNRSGTYETDISVASDQAAIDLYGLRPASTSSAHLFCDGVTARLSAQLQLQRFAVRNQYTFSTDERFIWLDPMDIVTVTDAGLGLDKQWVRILEIDLNSDGTLTFTVEEHLNGTGHAPAYSFQAGAGYRTDFNVDPGDVNTPVIFEAPVQIATSGLETWMAVSGASDWGGCDVWISSDGDTYKQAGRILGPARQGTLAATLPIGTDPDTSHTLSVDLSMSAAELLSGTQADADLGHTICYAGGEIIAYQTAALTGDSAYDLTYLRRGMYGTTIAAHVSGSQFARLDSAVFIYPYDKSQIGHTIYVKLASFNQYQASTQSLADIDPYTHVIAGPPKPANVTNFIVIQNGNTVNFSWTQIQDFALKGYDIGYAPQGTTNWTLFTILTEASKGTEMTNAAVPPGAWTFGIRGRDIADQLSSSPTFFDLTVQNNNDTTTVQKQEPEWAGTLSGFIRHWSGVLVPDSTTLANATTDFTVFDAFVPDPVATASYITPSFDIGYIASLRIYSAWHLTEGPGQTGTPTATTYLDAWQTGSDPATYVPWTVGSVPVRYLNMKVTYAPTTGAVAFLDDFTYTVDRAPIIEQAQSQTIAAGGTTVTFPQPFHDIPYVTATPVSSTAVYATASSITTTSAVIHVWNVAGTDVGGTVNYKATGV